MALFNLQRGAKIQLALCQFCSRVMFVVMGPWQTTAVRRRVDVKAARANVKDIIRSSMDTLQIAKRQLVGIPPEERCVECMAVILNLRRFRIHACRTLLGDAKNVYP